jgi:phage-related protein
MYEIVFYRDRNGKEPLLEYMQDLDNRQDKNSRININKIYDYLEYLREHGRQAGVPYIKHLDGEIWEVRPLQHRILFSALDSNSFVLLHHFIKKTRKTPQQEIDQAKRNLSDYLERSKNDE